MTRVSAVFKMPSVQSLNWMSDLFGWESRDERTGPDSHASAYRNVCGFASQDLR